MSDVLVKICGLTTEESVAATVEAGADMIGFNFYPKSPRSVSVERARKLGGEAAAVTRVALAVDPDDALVDAIMSAGVIDMLQVQGSETPERVAAIRARAGVPVMKALHVASQADIEAARNYTGAADRILFDAKAPKGMAGALPGGNGLSFDWRLLQGLTLDLPWMLAGGLNAENVASAIELTGAPGVDTASGVEVSPGRKSVEKIRAFIAAARSTA